MNFTQIIRVRADDGHVLADRLAEWDRLQAESELVGYIGTRLLADRAQPGVFLIVADFAEVEGDLTAAEEAERHNDRPETQAWAARLTAYVEGEPEYEHYDELYRTGMSRKGW